MPSDEIIYRETISVTRAAATEQDREISSQYNSLVMKALRKGEWYLTYGTPAQQMRIISSAMSSASKLAAIDAHEEVKEARIAFQQLLGSMTDVSEHLPVIVGENRIIDASTAPALEPTHHQDDEAGDEEP